LGAGGEPAPKWTATRPTSDLRSVGRSIDGVVIASVVKGRLQASADRHFNQDMAW
jgi:hypothetical protein